MIESLEQLAQYVQRTIPEPRALAALKVHEQSNYVAFQWHSTQFVIKKSMQVFELKGHDIFVSGLSVLMQAALMRTERNERVISVILESMLQVQNLVANGEDVASGLKLLSGIKQSLKKLAGVEGKQSRHEQAIRSSNALAAQPECAAA